MKSQTSMMEKPGENIPIKSIPIAHKTLAKAACLLEQKKNKIAETTMVNRPGNSRGNSISPRWRLLIKKVSFRKLLKVESTRLCEKPKINVAAKNSRKSRGKFKMVFLVRVMIILFLLFHYPNLPG